MKQTALFTVGRLTVPGCFSRTPSTLSPSLDLSLLCSLVYEIPRQHEALMTLGHVLSAGADLPRRIPQPSRANWGWLHPGQEGVGVQSKYSIRNDFCMYCSSEVPIRDPCEDISGSPTTLLCGLPKHSPEAVRANVPAEGGRNQRSRRMV